MRRVGGKKISVHTEPLNSDDAPEKIESPCSTDIDAFEQMSTPQLRKRASICIIRKPRASLPSPLGLDLEGAYALSKAHWKTANDMIAKKGGRWNDAETRLQLVRANDAERLIFAMDQIPRKQLKNVRAELAKGAAAFFAENGGFANNADNAFFLTYIASFFALFVKGGILELPFPPEHKEEIEALMDGLYKDYVSYFKGSGLV